MVSREYLRLSEERGEYYEKNCLHYCKNICCILGLFFLSYKSLELKYLFQQDTWDPKGGFIITTVVTNILIGVIIGIWFIDLLFTRKVPVIWLITTSIVLIVLSSILLMHTYQVGIDLSLIEPFLRFSNAIYEVSSVCQVMLGTWVLIIICTIKSKQ
ncbi:MAG: hypothetical protein Q4A48_04115 [Bacillota bacterium]|nr:hypothetical protein [Bacillota bacterium]